MAREMAKTRVLRVGLGQSRGKVSAIRTRDFRLVFYESLDEGELYDHRNDPGEIENVWADPAYADVRFDLLAQLMRFTLQYRTDTGRSSHEKGLNKRFAPTNLVHKGRRYWRDLKEHIQRRQFGRQKARKASTDERR